MTAGEIRRGVHAAPRFEHRLSEARSALTRRAVKHPFGLTPAEALRLADTMIAKARSLVIVPKLRSDFTKFSAGAKRAGVASKYVASFIRRHMGFLRELETAASRPFKETKADPLEAFASVLDDLGQYLDGPADEPPRFVANALFLGTPGRRGAPSARTLVASLLAGTWLNWMRLEGKPFETVPWSTVAELTAAICNFPTAPGLADSLQRAVTRAGWPGVSMGSRPRAKMPLKQK